MSKEISTIGKIWLIILCIIATFGIISNFIYAGQDIIYFISACACIAELVGLIFMLKGKGLVYLIIYSAAYIVNAVLVAMTTSQTNASWLVGFIFGVCLNIGLTYLAIKNSIKKNDK